MFSRRQTGARQTTTSFVCPTSHSASVLHAGMGINIVGLFCILSIISFTCGKENPQKGKLEVR